MNSILETKEEGYKKHYKEVTPGQTVEKIKNILSELGVEVEEHWNKESRIGTSSLRLSIKGTDIGTNGKGVSVEYATASAYAEFLERLQNNRISLCNVNFYGEDSYYTSADEVWMNVLDVVSQDNAVMRNFFASVGVDESYLKRVSTFQRFNRTELHLLNREDGYIMTPFYNITKDKVDYLPFFLYSKLFGSNGMSAGNTPEEAIVQGLSEIIERAVQKKLFIEKPCLPDIPDEVIAQYPYIEEMYKKLKSLEGYTVMLKDCSLGGRYPVAGLVVIEKNSGNYGIKLGCHPEFGIAMERAFTETAQGVDVTDYCHNSILDFSNYYVETDINITNSYRCGIAQFPFELFGDEPTYEYTPMPNVHGKTNKEIMQNWIAQLEDEGYEILIRNVSYLGFPSYHIIVPGLSEMRDFKELEYKVYNTKAMIIGMLRNPSLITKDNVKYVRACMEYSSNSQMENTMGAHYLLPMKCNLPGEEIGVGHIYLATMCDIMLRDYKTASVRMQKIIRHWNDVTGVSVKKEPDKLHRYQAIYQYCSAMNRLNNHVKVVNYLKQFFDKDIVSWLDEVFADPDEVITRQYPVIDLMDTEEHSYGKCDYKVMYDTFKKITKVQAASGIKQEDVRSILE